MVADPADELGRAGAGGSNDLGARMIECRTCHGSRFVRYPREIQPLVSPDLPSVSEMMDIAEYRAPCPDCAGGPIPQTRLMIVKQSSQVPAQIWHEAKTAIARSASAQFGATLFDKGLITIEQGEPDYRGVIPLRFTIGVVAPMHVASFEERVRERQFEVADAAVDAVIEEIANWGSFYHGRSGGSVSKDQAVDWLRGAVKKFKARFGRA